ncbi:MAG TPA: L-serine ammonia-lyase, iron-sulfur-dependent, subunit alpha [Bacillota bacterium]|nr:L-serine ammonia-lyase, iron-sulfur-dependent, subunit alpha [Bacillota bacterium]
MDKVKIIKIMNSEMKLATGCTEPGAVALAAALASSKLGEEVTCIKVLASSNIIKNAMAAGIPGTAFAGMDYAAALGAVGGHPERQLQVIAQVSGEAKEKARQLVESGKVQIENARVPEKLYIDITVYGSAKNARVVIANDHMNVTLIQVNGETIFSKDAQHSAENVEEIVPPEEIIATLNVETIYRFCQELDPENDDLTIIKQSIALNSAASQEGLTKDYGLKVGKTIAEDCNKGIITDDIAFTAMKHTAAAVDVRMAGADMPVVSNSGSGNQGITATVPVVAVAEKLGIGMERLIRAVTLSNLIVIYIKAKLGRLSALCGATVAATGAACGITYLLGGDLTQVKYAIQNMIGDVTGMLCDGAKADCALKVSTCTNAAIQAARMALKGLRVAATDGIVAEDVEASINNFAELGNKGSAVLDEMILQMMLDKQKRAI